MDLKLQHVHSQVHGDCLFSGRAPASLTLGYVRKLGYSVDNEDDIPINHGITVTVPGAAAAWCDAVEKFGSGKVKMEKRLFDFKCVPFDFRSSESLSNTVTSITASAWILNKKAD